MTVVDRSAWGRIRVTGNDRVRFLQGLTTVNVEQLADGAHGWGAILSPKGRVLSVLNATRAGEAFVLSCEPALAAPTRALLERYAVMDDVVFDDVSCPSHQVWTDVASVWTAPIIDAAHPDAVAPDSPAVERLRIRAGLPVYGTDVTDSNFPFETPLSRFLDYGKGCYVGQEPVFRVYSQGNAARTLRGLRIDGAEPVPAEAPIKHPAKDPAGAVTSQVADGDFTLALGYLHRTAWEPGDTVEIAGRRATVHELPWA